MTDKIQRDLLTCMGSKVALLSESARRAGVGLVLLEMHALERNESKVTIILERCTVLVPACRRAEFEKWEESRHIWIGPLWECEDPTLFGFSEVLWKCFQRLLFKSGDSHFMQEAYDIHIYLHKKYLQNRCYY